MKDVLRYDDLEKISSFLTENGYSEYDIEIVNSVDNKKTLNRINDDYFYRLNSSENAKPLEADEVTINVGTYKFLYKVKESDI